MAWTTVLDTVLAVGKPIRALHIRAIRDNIVALAQGLSGAPKIANAAFIDNTISGGRLSDGTTGAEKLKTGSTENAWVGARNVALGFAGIGTYSQAVNNTGVSKSPGVNIDGSQLSIPGYGTLTGTWRTCYFHSNGVAAPIIRVA